MAQQDASGSSYTETNTLAFFSFFVSIFWFFGLASIVAIVLGHIAHAQIRRSGEAGAGLALLGIILGWVGLIAAIVLFVIAMGSLSHETL
jgi:Domain of unknown function (DUF4190)